MSAVGPLSGSARVSRVGDGVTPSRTFVTAQLRKRSLFSSETSPFREAVGDLRCDRQHPERPLSIDKRTDHRAEFAASFS